MKSDSIGFLRFAIAATLLVAAFSLSAGARSDLQIEHLMAGTPYETNLYVLESGEAGHHVLVLGGVHGDEPGSWLAAEELIKRGPPEQGKLLVIPRANRQAVENRVRSTPELGDLNRLYFGDPEVFPMARMAGEIVDVAKRYAIDVVLDLHESWDFYEETSREVELSALGQTISPHLSEPSRSLTAHLVETVNAKLPYNERFHYHEFPDGHVDALIVPLPAGISEQQVPRKSGMDIPEAIPGIASILVEVGQQQPLERRVAQQVAAADALIALLSE